MAANDNTALLLRIEASVSSLQKNFKAAQAIVNQGADGMERRVSQMAKEMEAAAGKTNVGHGLAKGLSEANEAVKLTRNQVMELQHVARASFDQLAAGASPMRVLSLQGAQLAQALASGPGGVAGSLEAVGSLVNPVVGGIVLLTGVLVAMGAAFKAAADEADELRKFGGYLDATAVGAKYSAAELAGLRHNLSGAGVSAADATAALRSFVADGVKPERLEEFALAARDMAKVLNIEVPKAASELSQAFTGGYNDVKRLDDQIHFLTDAERQHIKALFDSKDAADGRNEAFRIFVERYGKAYNDTISSADRLTNALAGSWSSLATAMSNTSWIKSITAEFSKAADQWAIWLAQFEKVKALSGEQLQFRLGQAQQDKDMAWAKVVSSTATVQNYQGPKTGAHGEVNRVYQSLLDLQKQAQDKYNSAYAAFSQVRQEADRRATPAAGDTTNTPHGNTDKAGNEAAGKYSELSNLVESLKTEDDRLKDRFEKDTQTLADGLKARRLSQDQYDKALAELKREYGVRRTETTVTYDKEADKLDKPDVVRPMKDIDLEPLANQLKKIPELANPVRDALAAIGDTAARSIGDAIAYGGDLGDALANSFRQIAAQWVTSGVQDVFAALMKMNSAGGSGLLDGFLSLLSPLPAHATGTNFAPGGLSIVGERGPELVNLPRGSAVYTAAQTRSYLNGATAARRPIVHQTFQVNAQGAILADGIFNEIRSVGQQAALAGARGGAQLAGINLAQRQRRTLV